MADCGIVAVGPGGLIVARRELARRPPAQGHDLGRPRVAPGVEIERELAGARRELPPHDAPERKPLPQAVVDLLDHGHVRQRVVRVDVRARGRTHQAPREQVAQPRVVDQRVQVAHAPEAVVPRLERRGCPQAAEPAELVLAEDADAAGRPGVHRLGALQLAGLPGRGFAFRPDDEHRGARGHRGRHRAAETLDELARLAPADRRQPAGEHDDVAGELVALGGVFLRLGGPRHVARVRPSRAGKMNENDNNVKLPRGAAHGPGCCWQATSGARRRCSGSTPAGRRRRSRRPCGASRRSSSAGWPSSSRRSSAASAGADRWRRPASASPARCAARSAS